MSIYVLATLDTKGMVAALVCDRLAALGMPVTLIDCGCIGEPTAVAEVSRERVFDAAGTSLGA